MNFRRNVAGLVLNYRDASRTLRCVQSILDDGAEQVLVWDNSADSGVSAHALIEELGSDSRVVIEVSETNTGFAAGVNRGIECIRERFGPAWILILNNDAQLLPGGLKALSKPLEHNPAAIVSHPVIEQNEHCQGALWYHRWLALVTMRRLPGSFSYPSGCALLFAADRWSKALFDEEFFMYGEDVLLGWTHRGHDHIVHETGVWVVHEGSASSGMASPFYERRLVASHWLLARKMALNPFDYGWLLLGRAVSLPARAIARTLRYRSLEPLRALLGIAREESPTQRPLHPRRDKEKG